MPSLALFSTQQVRATNYESQLLTFEKVRNEFLKIPECIPSRDFKLVKGIVKECRDRQYYEKPNDTKNQENQAIKRRKKLDRMKSAQKGFRR